MKIKTLISLCVGILLGFSAVNAGAWAKYGRVICEPKDGDPVPVQGVLVVVVNTSGTYSNAAFTGADGSFVIALRQEPDCYVDFIAPATIPSGTTSVTPLLGEFCTTEEEFFITNCFVIKNPVCEEKEEGCWLTGGGTIRNAKGKPIFSFGGNVNPGCSPTAGEGGNWNVIAHNLKLHFQGTAIEVVDCGNVTGFPPGSTSPVTPFNFIEFQGTGTIKGIEGNKTKRTQVLFFGRAEDLGEPAGGIDRLYLRVFTPQGTTLLLISGTPGSPTTVSPIPISTGNLQIHISSCDDPPF